MAILLAGLSALLYGAADFCGGLGTRKGSLLAVLVFSQLVGFFLALGAALLLGDPLPGIADLGWGALAGACGAAGLAALYTAIATTPVAVASPVASVIGAAIPVLLGVLGGERPTAVHWIGIVLALPAMVLLSAGRLGPRDRSAARRAAGLGSLAGLGFGLFFFVIARTSHASGIWPLVAARVATISLVALTAGVTRQSLRPGDRASRS